jgi:hypothetical protein
MKKAHLYQRKYRSLLVHSAFSFGSWGRTKVNAYQLRMYAKNSTVKQLSNIYSL